MKNKYTLHQFRSYIIACSILTLSITTELLGQSTVQVNCTVDLLVPKKNISANIYGINNGLDNKVHLAENLGSRRFGGNRLSSFNWENNASNAGSDWNQSSDNQFPNGFGIPGAQANSPGKCLQVFHDTSLAINQSSTITVQMAGYVSKDKNGTVSAGEVAPSNRWCKIEPFKNASLSLVPDLNDNVVYMDEMVNYLVNKYGTSLTATGVKNYSLDNEVGLWPNTHPRIHPNKVSCVELLNKSVATSKAIKSIDPNAMVFGGVFSGWGEYNDMLGNSTDWNAVKGNHTFYGAWLLQNMKTESDKAGKRLLDVIDIHYYTEAQSINNGGRVWFADNSRENAIARMNCTRSLYDSTYKENSWITQYSATKAPYICLIPRIQKQIDTYYPGTKIAITEYNFGGNSHISGGIAVSDLLGVCGKLGVYQTNLWNGVDGGTVDNYNSAAFKIYRNYDGKKSTFGNKSVYSKTSNIADAPIYTSIDTVDNSLHIILINRNYDNAVSANVSIANAGNEYQVGSSFYFDKNSSNIKAGNDVTIDVNGKFSYQLPPQSVAHLVFKSSMTTGLNDLKIQEEGIGNFYPNPFTAESGLNYSFSKEVPSTITIRTVEGKVLYSSAASESGTIKLQSMEVNQLYLIETTMKDGKRYFQKVVSH